MPDSTELIRSFLAHQDYPCPGCSYNLRGVEQPLCPECGRKIELTIARPGRSRGYLLFVLLALGWVLTAGAMNTVRTWSTVRQEASTGLRLVQSFGGTLNPGQFRRLGPATVIPPRITSGQTAITIPPSPSGIGTSIVVGGGSFSVSTGGTIISQSFSTTTSTPARNWSSVSRQSWMALGWWAGLALAALAWLIVCLIRRHRFGAEQPPRILLAAAWSLFILYAGYHALMFTREFLT